MTLAATLVFYALDRLEVPEPDQWRSVLACASAGGAAALAVFCTPPVAIAAAALGVCLLFSKKELAVPFAGGIAVVAAIEAGALAYQGALGPMIRSMRWTMANYSIANHTSYGWVIGGYGHLFHALSAREAIATALVLLFLTLPATLPFLSLLWLLKRAPKKIVALLACGAGLLLSTYPRWDLIHLTYVAAIFYVLAATLISYFRFRKLMVFFTLTAAVSCLGITAYQRWSEPSRMTRLGVVHGPPADLQALETLQQRVSPADTLFVFPYRPIFYFLTRARNPTRYSFLQPGMFPPTDAQQALAELRERTSPLDRLYGYPRLRGPPHLAQ